MSKTFSFTGYLSRMTKSQRDAFQRQFSKRLKRRFDELATSDITQAFVADQLGVKRQSVGAWVLGQALPSTDSYFTELCRLLRITPAELMPGFGLDGAEHVRTEYVESKQHPGLVLLTVSGEVTKATAAKILAMVAEDKQQVDDIIDGK